MRFSFLWYILHLERDSCSIVQRETRGVSPNTKARFEGDDGKALGDVQWQVKTGRIRIEDVETYTEEQLQWKNAGRSCRSPENP